MRPRRALFTPLLTADGPQRADQIHPRRRTVCIDSNDQAHIINDQWRSDEQVTIASPYALPPEFYDLGEWTGYTEFHEWKSDGLVDVVDGVRGTSSLSPSDCPAKLAIDSLEHMLIHEPADDRCEHCLRGKLRNLRKLAGAFDRKTSRVGDLVTADHLSFVEDKG